MKICNYFRNMCQKFRLKNIDETSNYLLEEIRQSELMSRKQKKGCTTLNYIEPFLFQLLQSLDLFQLLILSLYLAFQ